MCEQVIQNWLSLADYDLETARAMMKSKRYLYVAFTCQQAIEKLLKAIYVKQKSDTPPYTHNLIRLLELLSLSPPFNPEQYQLLETLNSYYLESRYTEEINELFQSMTPQIAEDILTKTQELFTWIKSKIK